MDVFNNAFNSSSGGCLPQPDPVDPVYYTDWEVTQAHAVQIVNCLPSNVRRPVVRKYIAGVRRERLTEQLKSGVWLKPLGSQPNTTFSSLQDVTHSSLLIIAQGSSTGDSNGAPLLDAYRQCVRRLFHNKRGSGLQCEMYSTVRSAQYDIDEALQRKLDVQLFVISSRFREDK